MRFFYHYFFSIKFASISFKISDFSVESIQYEFKKITSFILIVNGKQYGVWRDFKNQYIYVSNDIDPNCPIKFAIHEEDHNESTLFAKVRSNFWFKQIINSYRLARLCFDNQRVKNNVLQELTRYLTF